MGEELTDVDEDVLHSLDAPGLLLHGLKLEIGCPVMLIRNLNVRDGLCNGTRLIITRLCDTHLLAELPGGHESFLIPRIPIVSETDNLPFRLQPTQFPLKLAINRSQGQTLKRVGLHLQKEIFAHGQLCPSNVRSIDCLSVFLGETKTDDGNTESRTASKNFVYQKVFT